MSEPTEKAAAVPRRPKYGWPSFAIAIVAALFYAYVFWGAVQNLIELPAVRGSATPWWLLILDVTVPVVTYAAAVLLGLRRRTLTRAGLFIVGATVLGCCVVSSLAFNLTH